MTNVHYKGQYDPTIPLLVTNPKEILACTKKVIVHVCNSKELETI